MRRVAATSAALLLAACSDAAEPDAQFIPDATPTSETVASGEVAASGSNVEQPLVEAIDHVWAGQRVWFDFVEQNDFQMIAYYDASRQMSVAVRKMRDVNGGPWNYHKLPSYLGWDAHNKVEAAFDERGIIHVVGNLHTQPLVYFRSTRPYDPRSLEPVDVMADAGVETRMTYPEFFKAPDGALVFKYRDGSSGQGEWLYNRWDAAAGSWSRLHDSVLLSGEDVRGVYPLGPVTGPDGYAHMTFTWRETPIASSNHDLSYARSRDLVNWERSDGTPIPLPITLSTSEVLDPIPEHGGLLNGRHPIGFDGQDRVLVSYQKYDDNDLTQVFLARLDGSEWTVVKVSDWDDLRVDLDKSGALDLPLITSEPPFVREGNIIVKAALRDQLWEWELDAEDLSILSGRTIDNALPDSIARYDLDNAIPQRVLPLMVDQSRKSREYFISWEAMQPNRDQARPDIPPASTLRVHRLPIR